MGWEKHLLSFVTNFFQLYLSYAKNMVLSGPLDSFRMGSGRRNQPCEQRVGLKIPGPLERGEGWLMELNGQWFSQSCLCNGISIKIPKHWGLESFGLV